MHLVFLLNVILHFFYTWNKRSYVLLLKNFYPWNWNKRWKLLEQRFTMSLLIWGDINRGINHELNLLKTMNEQIERVYLSLYNPNRIRINLHTLATISL